MESTQREEPEKEKCKEPEKPKKSEKNENKYIATKNQFEALGEETPETMEDERPQKEEKREEVELTKQEAGRGRGRKNKRIEERTRRETVRIPGYKEINQNKPIKYPMERITYTKQRNAYKSIKDTFIYQAEWNQHAMTTNY